MNYDFTDELEAMGVKDRVVSCMGNTVQVGEYIQNEKAKEHMLHGVARRLRFLYANIGVIISIAYVRRKIPLNDSEQTELSLHLNSLYLHIRGCLDNLTWCLIYELKLLDIDNKKESEIGQKANMFRDAFLEQLFNQAPKVWECIKENIAWNSELKTMRDPVAHRIPIYAVPAVLNPSDVDKYKQIYTAANAARLEGKYDLAGNLFKELNRIGDYVPYFAHSTSDNSPLRKVYPQVADDLAKTMDIIDVVTDYFYQRGLTTG